uniref:ANKRD40 C-terminal like n=1 Tax=Ailuropoda melanoleuca TaxID=9646 RepID=A0A7N5JW82_AILME
MAEPQQDRREKPAVRIQSPRENDFIEVELNRGELNYQNLLEVSCSELGIEPEQVKTIRKLPNTLLRKRAWGAW